MMSNDEKKVVVDGKEVSVKQFRNDWALALMGRGIIVRLSIGRWRAMARLNVEDLGLKFVDDDTFDFMQKYIRLGTQKLLPPEIIREIERVERKARDNLSDYSYDTLWGRFVPNRAFELWEKENKQIYEEFFDAAKNLTNRYDEVVVAVKNEYKKLARDVWARLHSDSGAPTDSFIENFSSRIVDKIPSRDDIFKSFKYSTTYLIIPMPSFLEEDLAKVQEIKRQDQMKNFDATLQRDIKQRIADDYVEKKKELIDGFLESTVSQMRKYVSELCDSVLQSIGKRRSVDKISIPHINKIKKMIKRVGVLNFHNDDVIDNLLKDLETEIDKFKGERNDNVVIDKLQEIVEVSEKEFIPENFSPAISYLEV